MRGRLTIAVGVLATLSVISVPAQQLAGGRASVGTTRVVVGRTPSVFTTIQGMALTAESAVLQHAIVRLRDARIGRIVGTLLTDDKGFFAFKSVDPGTYVVELMEDAHTIVAASSLVMVSVNAGEIASTVVRKPTALKNVPTSAGDSTAHASAVTSAAAASGILSSRFTGDAVSPR